MIATAPLHRFVIAKRTVLIHHCSIDIHKPPRKVIPARKTSETNRTATLFFFMEYPLVKPV